MYYLTNYESPLGLITLASKGDSLSGLWIEGQKYFQRTITDDAIQRDSLGIFSDTRDWLDRYFEGKKPSAKELPLAPEGSNFAMKVWNLLLAIPYGKTSTYGAIAAEIARILDRKSMSAQAVGGAVAHNPISIIIPCHRVIGTDGNLTGYAGGIDKKIRLLHHEGISAEGFTTP